MHTVLERSLRFHVDSCSDSGEKNQEVGMIAGRRQLIFDSVLTSSRAVVDQEELVGGAQLVGHCADHLSSCCCHSDPDGCVCVVAAVHL